MNTKMIAASVLGVLILMILLSLIWVPLPYYMENTPCDTPTITFSEIKQENGTGIYVTEVLEVDGEGSCGLRWDYWGLYLIDDEDLTYHYEIGGSMIIDNYSGNNTFYWTQEELSFERNLSAQISNDNGTEFPIHIQNEMTGSREVYNHSSKHPRQWLTFSVGDKIKIYGSGSEADGPAIVGWSLRIMYYPTGEIVSKINIP